jgi:hypothetical protein
MKRITEYEFDNHDCHAGPESSCDTCLQWQRQQDTDRRAVDEAMMRLQLRAI